MCAGLELHGIVCQWQSLEAVLLNLCVCHMHTETRVSLTYMKTRGWQVLSVCVQHLEDSVCVLGAVVQTYRQTYMYMYMYMCISVMWMQ